MDRATIGLGHLAAFGVGVTLAMTIFALVAAVAVRRASRSSVVWGRRIVEGIAPARSASERGGLHERGDGLLPAPPYRVR
jgi:hypothetical protein